MPTPKYGPRAGQHFVDGSPEMAAYIRAYGFGDWDVGENDGLSPAEAKETNNRDRVDQGGTYVPPKGSGLPALADAQWRAQLGNQQNYWDAFYDKGPGSVNLPQFQTANQDQARAQQLQVIQDLQRQAAGDPNSLAQQQLRRSNADAQGQQASLGSSLRGQSAGAAMRGVQQGQQGIQRGLAGDQQMLMAQEQQAAQAMLAQLLAQQQGQDITQAQGLASASLAGDALTQAMQQFYTQGGIQNMLGNYQYGSDLTRAQTGMDLEAENLRSGMARDAAGAAAGLFGTALNIGGNTSGTGGGTGGGYRQVGGKNTIVPDWDK